VVGWHNAGKTLFIEGMLGVLKGRGYRVAVVKHSGAHYSLDRQGTDTWRFTQAGADVVGLVGPDGLALMEHTRDEPPLEEMLARLPRDLDLVIVEGYKGLALPKIEVRADVGASPVGGPGEVLGMVAPQGRAGQDGRVFGPDDAEGVIDLLIRRGILRPAPERG